MGFFTAIAQSFKPDHKMDPLLQKGCKYVGLAGMTAAIALELFFSLSIEATLTLAGLSATLLIGSATMIPALIVIPQIIAMGSLVIMMDPPISVPFPPLA